ncbi:MAG: tetratricopeptide repeat protein [Planctomycetes bacterium]|nr:tetratricopeptide repeat protein [Planctomycetota bacterium]
MTTLAANLPGAARPVRSPWFRSATFDLLLILGVPFLTWPLLMLGQDAWGAPKLNQLIVLSATGHYFATFVRAYGDRELFARFKTRLLLAPPLLLILCVGMFASGHGPALMLVTAMWAFWHWLAQAFGFARIYDIKVGSFAPHTAMLDKALVIVGFLGAITLNSGSIATFGKLFLDAGLPLPGAEAFLVLQQVVVVAMIVVGTAYVANLTWTIVRGQPWSWQKQFMHVTTIGYYWFAFAWLPNVLIAYVLYELFHDIQYYAITWLTCEQRVRRPGVTPWFQAMFRPGWLAAFFYLAAMLCFGAIDFGGRTISPAHPMHQVWLGLFLTAALLHYYYDGFVWKARESALGSDLGIQGGLRATVVPGLRHAGRWALFAVPLALVLGLGGRQWDARERATALTTIAPGDFLSQAELAYECMRTRELPAAIEHYKAAIAANPDYAQARANYGNALDFFGDLDGAREQFQQALRCRDTHGAHAQAHINLGVLQLLRGERAAANEHFQAGAKLGGEHPIGRMLAMAGAVPADALARRLQLYQAVLQLDPNQPDARLGAATVLQAQRQFESAATHFAALLQRAPDYVPGLLGLATCQLELGRLDEARTVVQRALAKEPSNAQALALRGRLGG